MGPESPQKRDMMSTIGAALQKGCTLCVPGAGTRAMLKDRVGYTQEHRQNWLKPQD